MASKNETLKVIVLEDGSSAVVKNQFQEPPIVGGRGDLL